MQGATVMRNVNLNQIMKKLYSDDLYFVSIPPVHTEYEESYHEVAIDPDGNKRYLMEEREHSLAGIPEIKKWVSDRPGGKILDVGCGPGWFLSSLGSEWDRYGVEVSTYASKVARNSGAIHNGTLEEYTETGFDVIVMNHVIEHIADPVSVLKKIKNILNDDGVLIIGTPDFDSACARRYGKNFRFFN